MTCHPILTYSADALARDTGDAVTDPKPTPEDVERARDFLGSDWSNVDALALEFARVRAEEQTRAVRLASEYEAANRQEAERTDERRLPDLQRDLMSVLAMAAREIAVRIGDEERWP